MPDYASSLPIRSEADGAHERVHVKIVDKDNPGTQQTTVDTDGNLHVEIHGNDPAGVDRVVRLSELGALTPDGVYNATSNTKPGNSAIIVHSRAVSPGDAQSVIRATGINSSVNPDVWAQDVAIRDENGNPFSSSNPLPVTVVDSEGSEVNDYNTQTNVASGGTHNHDYTVNASKTLKLSQIWASASGRMKIEVQIETGVGTNMWNTKFVGFNSSAHPNILIPINENISVAAGVRVRVIRKNLDNQQQDVYSTIIGHEI